MPSRQASRSTSGLMVTVAGNAIPPSHGRSRLRRALIPFVALLLAAYVAVLALGIFGPQFTGTPQPRGGANWLDALSYPFAVAGALSPVLVVGIAVALVAVYGLCVLAVRGQPARATASAGADGGASPISPAGGSPNPLPPSLEGKGPHGEAPYRDGDGPHGERAGTGRNSVSRAVPAEDSARAPEQPSSAGEPTVFVSHNSGDNAFGYALTDKLRAALGSQTAVWYDSRGGPGAEGEWEGGIPPAAYFQDEIVRELTGRDVLVVILTERAMQSKWVLDEIALAWSQKNSADVTRGKVIVPVLRQTCKAPPLLSLVQYVDFRPEVDQAKALQDLLSAIRLRQTRPAPPIELGPPFDLGLLPPLERFVGRADDVQRVLRLLTEAGGTNGQIASVAAANGLGGIGKTALATEVVRRLMATTAFPDGIAVVICKGLTDPVEILRSVLARFVPDRRLPDDDTLPTLTDRARQLLGGRHALVVLDNVEKDNVEQRWLVREVIQPLRAAGASVLLTSRAELAAVPREASVRLEVLPLDEALDVFAEYLGRGKALDLTRPELDAATTIVESLGRHTLAVKLAAANAAALGRPLDTVARDLEQNPRRALLLEDSDEAVHYVLQSSYEALSPGARQLFVALAAFATSDVGREAALGVTRVLRQDALGEDEQQAEAEAERAMREVVALRLADAALDERIPADADRERLRLHPLVRTFADELLEKQEAEHRTETGTTVAAWYATYANSTPDLALASDEANIIGAIEWARAQSEDRLLARLCGGIAGFWRGTGRTFTALRYLPEGIAAAQRIAAATNQREDQLRFARLQSFYGLTLLTAGRLDEAQRYLEESLRILQEVGDRAGEGVTLNNLASLAEEQGRLAQAQRLYEESLAIARETQYAELEEAARTNLEAVIAKRRAAGEL